MITFSFVGKRGNVGGYLPNGKVAFATTNAPKVGERWWCVVAEEKPNIAFVTPIAPVRCVVVRTVERCPVCCTEQVHETTCEQCAPHDNGSEQEILIVCTACRNIVPSLIYHHLYGYPLPSDARVSLSAREYAENQAAQLARDPLFVSPSEIISIAKGMRFPALPERVWAKRTVRVTRYGDSPPQGALNLRKCWITDYEEQLYPSLNYEGEIRRLAWKWEEYVDETYLVNESEVQEALRRLQDWWNSLSEKERAAVVALAAHPCPVCNHPSPALCVSFFFNACNLTVFVPHEHEHYTVPQSLYWWSVEDLVERALRTINSL